MMRQVTFLLVVLTSILVQHHARTEARRPGIDVYRTVPGAGRFRLHQQSRSYEDAVVECGNEEAHLAVPVSKDVQDALLGMLHASNWLLAFIGVNDLAEEGRMVTVQGDLWSDVGYTRWESGEPNNAFGAEDCVVLTRNALLNDWNCTTRLAFFCEKNDLDVTAAPAAVPPDYVDSDDCGQSSALVNTLVVRGTATRSGEWPWMAAIFDVSSEAQFLCAGSLISKKHVLTAAHCLVTTDISTTRDPKSLVVHLGRYNLSRAEPQEQIMVVEKLLVHPGYKTSISKDHDVGILVLVTVAKVNDFVRPVCLWDNNLDPTPDQLVNKLGSAPGWGKNADGELAKDMRLAHMPVVSQSACLENDPEFFAATISNLTFCAGINNGTTLCNGDSGGGLFFYQENPKTQRNAWFVRGVVSLSKATDDFSCGAKNFVVFTDVSKILDWIKTSLGLTPPK